MEIQLAAHLQSQAYMEKLNVHTYERKVTATEN